MTKLPPLPRYVVAGSCVVGLTLVTAVPVSAAEGDQVDLTLVATTDVHSHIFDWNYFQNAPFPEDDGLGLTRVQTVLDEVRERQGEESVIYVDNGDAIQGNPLATYFSTVEPVNGSGLGHPMALAYNRLGLDAQTLGNHEYNYGLDMLAYYQGQLEAPTLAANVVHAGTEENAETPYTLIEREIDGRTVTVGVLGLVVPGVATWDRAHVEGKLEFRDLVQTAQEYVPEIAAQADVVVVTAHSGIGSIDSEDYDPTALEHDVVRNIAELVAGIDVIVAGHSHQDNPAEWFSGPAGEPVLVTQPVNWARSVSEVTIPLVEQADGSLDVQWGEEDDAVTRHYTRDYEEDPQMAEELAEYHEATVEYVNTPVAQSVTRMSTETSRYEDTPIIDFINHVQQESVAEALADTEYADLPVASQASPFSRTAVFPEGQVSIRDVAGLYVYDNTLGASLLTGAQLKDYLEHSALYYETVPAGEEFDPERHTNAKTPYYQRDSGTPDYALDQLAGVNYVLDLSQPGGARVVELTWPDGTPVQDEDEFILAVNNYRQNGGSAYPHVADAPVVWNELLEVRQLLIEWAVERETIDPADFAEHNWEIITSASGEEPAENPNATLYIDVDRTGRAALTTDVEVPVSELTVPITGDFLGDSSTQVAYRHGAQITFPEGVAGSEGPVTISYGRATDIPVVGDWDGDGVDTVAMHRGDTFFLTNSFAGGVADETVHFGRVGDVPIAGAWDGAEADSVGVIRGTTWFLADGSTNRTAQSFTFGRAGDIALIGDWDGDGTDTIGVRRANRFLLSNAAASGNAGIDFTFGRATDVSLVGDWGGEGDSVAVLRPLQP